MFDNAQCTGNPKTASYTKLDTCVPLGTGGIKYTCSGGVASTLMCKDKGCNDCTVLDSVEGIATGGSCNSTLKAKVTCLTLSGGGENGEKTSVASTISIGYISLFVAITAAIFA
jgi:hypothetical protein